MKKIVFITLLGLWGCNINNPLDELQEKVVFSNESNCYLNLDSLGSMDNYILFYRAAKRKGLKTIKPYIKTVNGKRISLRELRPKTGRGYFFDGRSRFIIYVYNELDFYCYWSTGKSNNFIDKISISKKFNSKEDLMNEIIKFYTENSSLKMENEPDKSELEIYITPNNDELSKCIDLIELSAIAYQRFMKTTKKNGIPFSVVLSPKIDNNRMKRIIEKENK